MRHLRNFYFCYFLSQPQVASDGNWMHIHYQSKLQAKKSLSKNGKVFGNSIMVGVTPCIDKVSVIQYYGGGHSLYRQGQCYSVLWWGSLPV